VFAKQVLSQLSYTPTYNHLILMDFSEDDHLLPVAGVFANLSYTPERCNHHPPNSVRNLFNCSNRNFQPMRSNETVFDRKFEAQNRSSPSFQRRLVMLGYIQRCVRGLASSVQLPIAFSMRGSGSSHMMATMT